MHLAGVWHFSLYLSSVIQWHSGRQTNNHWTDIHLNGFLRLHCGTATFWKTDEIWDASCRIFWDLTVQHTHKILSPSPEPWNWAWMAVLFSSLLTPSLSLPLAGWISHWESPICARSAVGEGGMIYWADTFFSPSSYSLSHKLAQLPLLVFFCSCNL